MNEQQELTTLMKGQGILPLYFHPDAALSQQILSALYQGGARAVEYTNRGPEALTNFTSLVKFARQNMPDMKVGLGTVLDPQTADRAMEAGADFIISPGADDVLLARFNTHAFPWIPGCLTPSEVLKVYRAGIRLIKIFPGNLVGPDYVRSIRDLFPGMAYMPTGGVKPEKDNLEAWHKAGVVAVGMGSTLIPADIATTRNFDALAELMQKAKSIWKQIAG